MLSPMHGCWRLLLLTASLLAGCQATLPRDVQPQDAPEGNAELVQYIADLPYVTADAAYRAVYVLVAGEAFEGDYDDLKQDMRRRGLLVADVSPRRLLDRGTIATLIARACDIRTGLNWRLTGLGRYAWRELQYQGIGRTSAGEFGYVSGGEFLGMLSRAEDYMRRTGRLPATRVELGPPPSGK